MDHFPRDPEDLTPEWLTDKLSSMEVLTDGVSVESFGWEPIGNGYAAKTVRIEPAYSGAGAGPASLVGKFRADFEPIRAWVKAIRAYEREVWFYEKIVAPDPAGSQIRTPGFYGAEFDADDGSFVLLLEDIHDAEPGDHIAGCSPERAEQVFRGYARMHARWWESPLVTGSELFATDEARIAELHGKLETAVPALLDALAPWIGPPLQRLLPRLPDRYKALLRYSRNGEDRTLIHGDAHVANFLFPTSGAPIAIDWQAAAAANGTEDLARFAMLSMRPEDRRTSQNELIAAYADELAEAGAERPSTEIEAEFDAMTLLHIANTMLAITSVDVSTEQGQETAAAVVPRIDAAAKDVSDIDAVLASISG